jgi:hypothetical protein
MPTLHRSVPVALACVTFAVLVLPLAGAAQGRESPVERLLEEYPLNPTGERIVSARNAPSSGPSLFRPPVAARPAAGAAVVAGEPASGSSPFLLAVLGAGSLVALLGAAALVWAYARSRATPKDSEAYVSGVFVEGRHLPVIDAPAPRRRWAVSSRDLAPALAGGALALLAAYLVLHFVG